MRAATVVAALAVLAAVPTAARAAPLGVTITVGNHFTPGDLDPYPVRIGPVQHPTVVLPLTIPAGNDLLHINRDLEGHNVTSVAVDANGDPLFSGPTIDRSSVAVIVTSHLPPGEYGFVCTIHSEFMIGLLSIT